MRFNIVFDDENRPLCFANADNPQEGGVTLDVPENIATNLFDYVYTSGSWVYEPRAGENDRLEEIAALRERLSATDGDILAALESLFSATSVTGFITALANAGEKARDVLAERAALRAQIAELTSADS